MFIVLRHQLTTVQAVLALDPDKVSPNMIYWAQGLSRESVVLVEGRVQKPPAKQTNVRSATIHDVEVKIHKVSKRFPFHH